jgi:hypothetical protein
MTRFYQPDLSTDLDSPFVRDSEDKLIRRSYWLDMDDRTLVMVMVNGIGANLTNDEKRAHLIDLRREHLIEKSVFRKSFRRRGKYPYGDRGRLALPCVAPGGQCSFGDTPS